MNLLSRNKQKVGRLKIRKTNLKRHKHLKLLYVYYALMMATWVYKWAKIIHFI